MPDTLRCAACGRADVRLYRIAGNFLRYDDLFCNLHIPDPLNHLSAWVPCISAPDGSVWGYTSCPPTDVARWEALPDTYPPLHWRSARWYFGAALLT